MEAIFHEQQDGSLCAQHCLNSLLQGQFYSAVDLADLATELDTMEKLRMAEMGEDTPEYRQFLEQPSTNMDDSGFFSVQVITRALSVWGLDLLPLNSSNPTATRAKASPISANAYICNFREHWFTIRRLGSQWFNLNSLLEGPELVSNTYLGEFLAQLQHEGYDIFLVTGELPPCDADLVLQAVPATQLVPPRLLSDVTSSGNKSKQGRQRSSGASPHSPASGGRRPGQTDEEADLEAAMLLSLAETSGAEGGPANIDNEELARVMEMQRQGGWGPETVADDDMEMALRMSQDFQQPQQTSEEDEIQKAIALSLEGGVHLPSGVASGSQDVGWGARLRQQEVEEEQRYKEEQEKAAKQEAEELEKALAMSMETEEKEVPKEKSKPVLDPVNTAWPKVKNPAPGTLAGNSPAPPASVKPKKSPMKSTPGPSTSKSPETQKERPSISEVVKPLMPEGPGHKLGGAGSSSVNRTGVRPGPSAAASGASQVQPKTDDPEEIRRRRMAFLDKLQKSPQKQ